MDPPPAASAPSQFLLPSRRQNTQRAQSRQQTPKQPPQRLGHHQFHPTPRFSSATPGPPALHAPLTTPAHPPLSLKPATARNSRTPRTHEIIDDGSSQPSAAEFDIVEGQSRFQDLNDIDSSFVSQSPYRKPVNQADRHENGRLPKRRRISIASSDSESDLVPDSHPLAAADLPSYPSANIEDDILADTQADAEEDEDEEGDDIHSSISQDDNLRIPPISPIPTFPISSAISDPPSPTSSSSSSRSSSSPSPTLHPRNRRNRAMIRSEEQSYPQQPTFHPPPRFKPPDKGASEPAPNLPDIFSPTHRRGARYTPGGLASELREWLVEIKETDLDPSAQTHPAVQLKVDQVRYGGPGMTLIEGRMMDEGGKLGMSALAVLTGEGEGIGSIGEGVKKRVKKGGVVVIAPPAWDVELSERWAIAYRWGVISEGESGQEGENG